MAEVKTYTRLDKLYNSEVFASYLKTVEVYGEDQDYRSNEMSSIRMSLNKDGSLVLSDDDRDSIYFNANEIEHLAAFIKKVQEFKV